MTCRGIELMPLGIAGIQARLAAELVDPVSFARKCDEISRISWKGEIDERFVFRHLRITEGAFPLQTEQNRNQFSTFLSRSNVDEDTHVLLRLACLSILESISYTRKDGQYLRWDHRSPRDLSGKLFDEGTILSFDEALRRQLTLMRQDIGTRDLFSDLTPSKGQVLETQGSCLSKLPTYPEAAVDAVITSPPYCNRYDYTRTYALELAYLGVDEEQLKSLRQSLLSCTVENRSKLDELRRLYYRGNQKLLHSALAAFDALEAAQDILHRLDYLGQIKRLNNSNVPRMVRSYFLESTIVVFELARIVKRGGCVVMVNDNVQYGGEEIPVDLIMSSIAESAGFAVERIWMLPRGKGNSSQQMGKHGRKELRKCVYVWRR